MPHPIRPRRDSRAGVAAVEFAFIVPVMLALLIGVWEVGRLIQIQQIMNAAVRDAARLAAQGQLITDTGSYVYVYKDPQPSPNAAAPNVRDTIKDYLTSSGITTLADSDITLDFHFLDGTANDLSIARIHIVRENDRGEPGLLRLNCLHH